MKMSLPAISFFLISGTNILLFLYFYTFQTYPLFLLIIHVLSIFVLWAWVIKPVRMFANIKTYRKDLLLILCLVCIAFFARVYMIDTVTPGMWGDEVVVAVAGIKTLQLHSFLPYIPDYIGHPTPLLYLIGLSIHFLGKTILAIRLPSILFGVGDVIALYLLLRQFFTRANSFVVSLLVSISYSHLVLSRFDYDMTAAIFFQIIALYFLYKSYSTKQLHSFVGLALSLGMGLFTYYSFRSFMILFIFLTFFCVVTQEQKLRYTKILLFLLTLFSSTILLTSHDAKNMNDLLARTKALSVFNQGFTPQRTALELGGNVVNDFGALVLKGDPTPRQNPSGTSMFDIISTVLYFIGVVVLFKKNKTFLIVSVLFILFALINDFFTVEIFPEFHFYGTGHPNLLRISGIIPIIYIWIAYGLTGLQKIMNKLSQAYAKTFYISIIGVILFLNWFFYFNQPLYWNVYNYKFNGARMIRIAQYMNNASQQTFFISNSFILDGRVRFFIEKNKHLVPFTLTDLSTTTRELEQHTITIIDPEENTQLAQSLVTTIAKSNTLSAFVMTSPFGTTDALIISKK